MCHLLLTVKRVSFFTVFFCTIFITSFGKIGLQAKPKPYYGDGGFDPDRVILGGSLGMNFFKNGYSLFVFPNIGYSFGRLQLGISGGYNFYHEKIPYKNALTNFSEEYKYNASNYNVSIYSRLFLLGPLFIQAEPGFEFIKILEDPAFTADPSTGKAIEHNKRVSVPVVQAGAGFAFPIGDRIAFIIYGLYDVVQDKYSPYKNYPIIRGGFYYGNFR